MNQPSQEKTAWEQFCKTGAVSDYIAYRQVVDYTRVQPAGTVEEEPYADSHRRAGGAGETPGGA